MAAVAASRVPQPGVVWLGLGCTAVGVFMLGHGLLTPGVFGQPTNRWVGRLPYLAMASFALCLYIGGRRADRGINRWVSRHPVFTLLVPTVAATMLVAAVVRRSAPVRRRRAVRPREHGPRRPVDVDRDPPHQRDLDARTPLAARSRHRPAGDRARRRDVDRGGLLVRARALRPGVVVGLPRLPPRRVRRPPSTPSCSAATNSKRCRTCWRRRSTTIRSRTSCRDIPRRLNTLVRAVEVKDAYTHGHSQRTAQLAVELGLADGTSSRSAAGHLPRRLPPRHRQDRDPRRDLEQARAGSRPRSASSSRPTRNSATSSPRTHRRSARCSR